MFFFCLQISQSATAITTATALTSCCCLPTCDAIDSSMTSSYLPYDDSLCYGEASQNWSDTATVGSAHGLSPAPRNPPAAPAQSWPCCCQAAPADELPVANNQEPTTIFVGCELIDWLRQNYPEMSRRDVAIEYVCQLVSSGHIREIGSGGTAASTTIIGGGRVRHFDEQKLYVLS